MVEKQNDLKEVIVHLRTPSGAPAGTRKDLSGESARLQLVSVFSPTPQGPQGMTRKSWLGWGTAIYNHIKA